MARNGSIKLGVVPRVKTSIASKQAIDAAPGWTRVEVSVSRFADHHFLASVDIVYACVLPRKIYENVSNTKSFLFARQLALLGSVAEGRPSFQWNNDNGWSCRRQFFAGPRGRHGRHQRQPRCLPRVPISIHKFAVRCSSPTE